MDRKRRGKRRVGTVAGGTIVRDRVRYELPFGSLGQIAAGRFVAADLERIFDDRGERMRDTFGTAGEAPARRAS